MACSDWTYGELGTLFDTVTGNTPPKNNIDNYGNNISFVKPPELRDSFITETNDGLSHQGALLARVLPSGSILVSCIGNLGKVGLTITPVAFNQQINAIKPSNKALPKFMFYQSLSPNFKIQLENLASGTTVPIVNKSKFNSIQVAIPSLTEQKRIVAILDQAFAEIDKARANAEQNLKNARELFESYLQQVFSQRGEGWVEKSILDLTTILGDGLHGTPKYSDDGSYYFINGNNLNDGKIELKAKTKRVNKVEYEKYKKPLNDRTVFVSINGTLGNVAFYNDEKVILGKSACYFNLCDDVNKKYVKFVIESPLFQKYCEKEATGATIKNVSLKTMRAFLVPLAPDELQELIVNNLNRLKEKTLALEVIYAEKLNQLDELKKSILQKAFTGELTQNNNKGMTG